MESIWTREYTQSIKKIVRQALWTNISNYPDFEDLEQEAMQRIVANHSKIPTGVSRKSYIHSMAVNCAYDTLRQRQHLIQRQTVGLSSYVRLGEQDDNLQVCDQLITYQKEHADPFIAKVVAETVSQLSPQHQKVLMLKAEGYAYQDMARVLNISVGTVRSRLHYARKYCAKLLAPHVA